MSLVCLGSSTALLRCATTHQKHVENRGRLVSNNGQVNAVHIARIVHPVEDSPRP